MKTYKKRLQRIEEVVHADEGLTCEDVDLILSCLPPDIVEGVKKKLFEIGEDQMAERQYYQPYGKRDKTKRRSGLHGKTLQSLLDIMPTKESAEALKAKVQAMGI